MSADYFDLDQESPIREADNICPASQSELFYSLQRSVLNTVREHGPYSTHKGTTVFARASVPFSPGTAPSTKEIAESFAVAQDCFKDAQPAGPAEDDLMLFKQLYDVATVILEDVLRHEELDSITLGWALYGLAAGHMDVSKPGISIKSISSYKYRLRAALSILPSLSRRSSEYVISEQLRVERLVKARKELHLCTVLLTKRFQQEDWQRIRLWHTVAVVERLLSNLEYSETAEKAVDEDDRLKPFRFP